jgi:dihydrofolate reductase
MGKAIMGAVVSLDGFIADSRDEVGPLFDWLANGDVTWSFPGTDREFRTTRASADFMQTPGQLKEKEQFGCPTT